MRLINQFGTEVRAIAEKLLPIFTAEIHKKASVGAISKAVSKHLGLDEDYPNYAELTSVIEKKRTEIEALEQLVSTEGTQFSTLPENLRQELSTLLRGPEKIPPGSGGRVLRSGKSMS